VAVVLLLVVGTLWQQPAHWLASPLQSTPSYTGVKGKEDPSSYRGVKGKGAYLLVQVDQPTQGKKRSPGKKKRPLRQRGVNGASYPVGAYMIFRFLITTPGHVYLLRRDEEGKLEYLFPFSPKDDKFYQVGEYSDLRRGGQPQAYYLDRDLLGHQTLFLVHSKKRLRFPADFLGLHKKGRLRRLPSVDRFEFAVHLP